MSHFSVRDPAGRYAAVKWVACFEHWAWTVIGSGGFARSCRLDHCRSWLCCLGVEGERGMHGVVSSHCGARARRVTCIDGP